MAIIFHSNLLSSNIKRKWLLHSTAFCWVATLSASGYYISWTSAQKQHWTQRRLAPALSAINMSRLFNSSLYTDQSLLTFLLLLTRTAACQYALRQDALKFIAFSLFTPNHMSNLKRKVWLILCTFANNKRLLYSSCLCVHIYQGDFHWADFHKISYLILFIKFVDTVRFWLMSDKNNIDFTERPKLVIYGCASFLIETGCVLRKVRTEAEERAEQGELF